MGKNWLKDRGLVWILLAALPVGLALLWGEHLRDGAYALLRVAQAWGRGEWLSTDAPLYVGSVLLLGKAGIPLAVAAMAVSALGWGVVAIALWEIGRELKWESLGLLVGVLLVVHPVTVEVWGTEVSWVLAWGWLLGLAWLRGARWLQMVALVGLCGTHGGVSTAGLGLLWLGVGGWGRKRVPVWESLVLVGAGALSWWLGGGWSVAVSDWRLVFDAVMGRNELYWVWVPWMGVGVWALWARGGSREKALAGVSVLWLLLGLLSPTDLAAGIVLTVVWFLSGSGLAWSVRALAARVRVSAEQLRLIAGSAVLLLVGGVEIGELEWQYTFRPVELQALVDESGAWLKAHSEADARILGPARVGYVAERASVVWPGSDMEAMVALLLEINADPPEYCVTTYDTAWELFTQSEWFQDGYEQVQQFTYPSLPFPLVTVWRFRFSEASSEVMHPLAFHLLSGVDWTGYKYWPVHIHPGEPVYVTLFLQATKPVSEPFRTLLKVTSADGATWGEAGDLTPRSSWLDRWQPGQTIAESFRLETAVDIPEGRYQVGASMVTHDWKRSLLYEDRERYFPLGEIEVASWRERLEQSTAMNAVLEDRIKLLGFESADVLTTRDTAEVALYWEAEEVLEEDYVVFVHLVNAEGQLIANHDGPPVGGAYPTSRWQPGVVVRDVHEISLGAILPGTYWLQAGMYRWPSLEHLQIEGGQGMGETEEAIVLQPLEIR
ncbi:MAG: hypothetical protein RBT47_01815 [Anaerolineae bacterium]|jgi:hypothetical protein|nr:hypothetical protein [Anaerolineae bacterium]